MKKVLITWWHEFYSFQMQSEYFETVNMLNKELEQVQLDLR